MARSLAQKLTEAWGHQVIVDNRAGASGVLAMQIVASGPRDGYTLLLGSSTQFSIYPGLRSVPYDPVRDYTPVILAAQNPVLAYRPTLVSGKVGARADSACQGKASECHELRIQRRMALRLTSPLNF